LASRDQLAFSYAIAGRLEEAIDVLAQVFGERERALGDQHPRTETSFASLVQMMEAAGRTVEADALRQQWQDRTSGQHVEPARAD
jgi:hypothetical protein